MALTSTLAVLDDAGMLTYSYATKQYGSFPTGSIFQIGSLSDLLCIAHALEIDTLWIMPGSDLSRRAKAITDSSVDQALSGYHSKKRDGTPRFQLVWNNNQERNHKSVKLAWPEHDSRWPWSSCSDASTLLKSILYLQDALESDISWSPGHVGQQLMLSMNEKHPAWLAPAEIPDTVKLNLAVDMQWKRALYEHEHEPGMYLHLFDKNAMYLGACTSALLGEGSPLHLYNVSDFNPRVPGLWRIGDRWTWTPELEYQFSLAANRPKISEAWIWPKSHTTLRGWGEHMWAARQELSGPDNWPNSNYPYPDVAPRQMAYKAVKSIYTQGMGWLAMESNRGDNKLYRPDWWSMIVSTAVRTMQFKIKQLGQNGMYPVYVNVDTLGIVTQGESLEPFHTHILNRPGQLGGFKHVASLPLTPGLAALFEEGVSFRDCQNGVLAAQEEGVKV